MLRSVRLGWLVHSSPVVATVFCGFRGYSVTSKQDNGSFVCRVHSERGHVCQTDLVKESGGTDTSMTPMEMMMAGLASCTNNTIFMYANMKKIPLRSVTTEVRDVTQPKKHVPDAFERRIMLDGDGLDEATVARLLAVADKCPCHEVVTKSLSAPSIHIPTTSS